MFDGSCCTNLDMLLNNVLLAHLWSIRMMNQTIADIIISFLANISPNGGGVMTLV
jgi:hypothetical protein